MGPQDSDSQDQPTDSDESIPERIERSRIADLHPREAATGPVTSRSRALVDPLPDPLSRHLADEEGADRLSHDLRAIQSLLEPRLERLRGEHRRVLKAVSAARPLGHCVQRTVPFRLTRSRRASPPGSACAVPHPAPIGNLDFP